MQSSHVFVVPCLIVLRRSLRVLGPASSFFYLSTYYKPVWSSPEAAGPFTFLHAIGGFLSSHSGHSCFIEKALSWNGRGSLLLLSNTRLINWFLRCIHETRHRDRRRLCKRRRDVDVMCVSCLYIRLCVCVCVVIYKWERRPFRYAPSRLLI